MVFNHAQIEARSVLLKARLGIGCCIPVLPTTIIRPHPRSRIAGSNFVAIRIGETTIFWNHFTKSASAISDAVQRGGPPWFSTKMSTPPIAATAASASRSIASPEATSATTPTALAAPSVRNAAAAVSSVSWDRPLIVKAAPSAASASAIDRPSPFVPPITSARRFFNPKSMIRSHVD